MTIQPQSICQTPSIKYLHKVTKDHTSDHKGVEDVNDTLIKQLSFGYAPDNRLARYTQGRQTRPYLQIHSSSYGFRTAHPFKRIPTRAG